MKKFIVLSLLAFGPEVTCLAQNSHPEGKFSMGIDYGIPMTDYDSYYKNDLFKYGIGGSLNFDIPTSASNFYVTLSGGICSFQANDKTAALIKALYLDRGATSEEFVPLKAGIKYYFSKGFFGEIQAGIVIHPGPTVEFISNSDRSVAYSPGIGYCFNNGIEIGARYEVWKMGGTLGNMSQLGIRVAYAFKLPD